MQNVRHCNVLSFPTDFRRLISKQRFPVAPALTAAIALLLSTILPVAAQAQPSVPAGLAAKVVSPTQINLSWNPSTGSASPVAGYYVYRNDVQLTNPTQTTTGTSFQDFGLAAGTTYNYRVSSIDAAGNNSAWTTPVAATTLPTDTEAPTIPGGLVAAAVSPTQINLSWNPAADNVTVAGYGVYLNDQPLAQTTATSFRHAGLNPGTTYNYRVSAFDEVPNHGAWSAAPVSATTPASDAVKPSIPTGLAATAVSSTQVNLSWNPATDNLFVAGYHVYLNDQAVATTTGTSFQHIGLSPSTTYNYRVRAFDAVPNQGDWTATPVSVTTPPADSIPPLATFSGMLDEFPNPERGLSRMVPSNLSDIALAPQARQVLTNHRNSGDPNFGGITGIGYRLVTHRQLLSDYVNTPLPQSFIYSLNAAANLHRLIGTKMAMQFSYNNIACADNLPCTCPCDPNTGAGTVPAPEPTLMTIRDHIRQLSQFFKANADVIASVHAGFLGTWGEWGFSREPSVAPGYPLDPTPSGEAKKLVRDELMSAVDRGTPIAFRNLADLKNPAWFPTPLNASQAFTESPQARSGVHNDCFLSNKDDSGTYWARDVSPTGRTPEDNEFRAYHRDMSEWTTTGGENCGDGEPALKECPAVLTDGPLYHWRYRRDDWGLPYNTSWSNGGCYPEIKRSLGYRFRLDAITHPTSVAPGTVNVAVDLRNVGWSRIFTPRKLVVTLKRADGTLLTGSAGDMRFLPSQATSSTRVVVPVTVPSAGTYDVYVSMPDVVPGVKDNPDFAVRFANAEDPARGQGWETANSRFKTGTTLTVQ